MWRNAELTDVGLKLLSGMLNGGKLTITRAAIGGGAIESEKLSEQTELTEPITTTVSIAGAKELPDKNGRALFVRILNNGVAKTARMKQVGIFAKTDSTDEVLLAITQDDIGEEIPPYAEFPDFLIEFNFVLVISRTNNITVMTDLSTVATREDLEQHNADETAHAELFAQVGKKVISERIRDPSKPDYGLGGGGEWSGALEVSSYSGNAEVTVVLNGTEYDGDNISRNAENAPDGTIIIKEI